MLNWKVTGGFAGFGALVSLISGFLGGNPFGNVLLKMLASSFLLAAVGFGVGLLIRRYLPELAFNRESQDRTGDSGPDSSGEVDIVIPEENPHLRNGVSVVSSDLLGREVSDISEGAVGLDKSEENAEEVEEVTAEDDGEVVSSDLSGREEVLEEEPALLESPSTDAFFAAEADVDSLPEMEGIEGSFTGASESEPASPAGRSPSPSDGMDDSRRSKTEKIMQSEDPAYLAKAVRTFLKKDQEG